jgi:hypothetical protein
MLVRILSKWLFEWCRIQKGKVIFCHKHCLSPKSALLYWTSVLQMLGDRLWLRRDIVFIVKFSENVSEILKTAREAFIPRLLLLIKRYNLYKVLACSTTFFHLSLFCATFFQLHKFMLFISSKTSSARRVLGLPIGLLDMGFQLLISSNVRILKHNSIVINYITFPNLNTDIFSEIN